MEGSKVTHHLFVYFLLVCVNSLGVLAKVVKSGEMFSTMTIERTLSSVFSGENERGSDAFWVPMGGYCT
jgi:hypothetical protein